MPVLSTIYKMTLWDLGKLGRPVNLILNAYDSIFYERGCGSYFPLDVLLRSSCQVILSEEILVDLWLRLHHRQQGKDKRAVAAQWDHRIQLQHRRRVSFSLTRYTEQWKWTRRSRSWKVKTPGDTQSGWRKVVIFLFRDFFFLLHSEYLSCALQGLLLHLPFQ